jgi:hypothetical protein
MTAAISLPLVSAGWAIDVAPGPQQVAAALEQGRSAAVARIPPDRLYAWFGGVRDVEPKGFVMTKMAGLRVMSAHFALRAATPSDEDIGRVLDETSLLISVTIFGARPTFAVDSYMVLAQGERVIKPVTVRFDGQAARSPAWPHAPAFQAKVVASFAYADVDPKSRVFPADGGEIVFDLDLAAID